MSNLFLTLMIAFVVIVFAIACLAIGWLITGKTKIERGSCGRDPTKRRDASCDTDVTCDLCHPESESEKKLKEKRKEDSPNIEKEEGDKRY